MVCKEVKAVFKNDGRHLPAGLPDAIPFVFVDPIVDRAAADPKRFGYAGNGMFAFKIEVAGLLHLLGHGPDFCRYKVMMFVLLAKMEISTILGVGFFDSPLPAQCCVGDSAETQKNERNKQYTSSIIRFEARMNHCYLY